MPEPAGADEPGLRRVRRWGDRLPVADGGATVRLLHRAVPAGQCTAARPYEWHWPAAAAHRLAAVDVRAGTGGASHGSPGRGEPGRRGHVASCQGTPAADGLPEPVRGL